MPLQSLEDAFVDELRDILRAEKQLIKALPKMTKGAGSEGLRTTIEQHLGETKIHVERLETIFESLELTPRAKKCEAMEGLLEEGASLLEENATEEVLDALINCRRSESGALRNRHLRHTVHLGETTGP